MPDTNSLAALLEWLEEEKRRSVATTTSMQQQIARIEDHLLSLHGGLGEVRAAAEGLKQQTEADARQRLAEVEHQQQTLADLVARQSALERDQAAQADHLALLEESLRHRQEELAGLNLGMEALQAQETQISATLGLQQTLINRQAEEIAAARNALNDHLAEDEQLAGRIQHLGDQLRRLESGEEIIRLEERLRQALAEQAELHRIERQRLERLYGELQAAQEALRGALQETHQQGLQTAAKLHALRRQSEQIREEFEGIRGYINDRLAAIGRVEEQHRRRTISELERQLKDLSVWDTRSAP